MGLRHVSMGWNNTLANRGATASRDCTDPFQAYSRRLCVYRPCYNVNTNLGAAQLQRKKRKHWLHGPAAFPPPSHQQRPRGEGIPTAQPTAILPHACARDLVLSAFRFTASTLCAAVFSYHAEHLNSDRRAADLTPPPILRNPKRRNRLNPSQRNFELLYSCAV